MSVSWQATQADALLRLNYGYVALISLWLYDYILCMPDAVTFIAKSRRGLGTVLYLCCSHFPFAFLLLDMLVFFQPDAPLPLCRSYFIANIYIGALTMFLAECIFILRTYAVCERKRWHTVFVITSTISYLVPIIVCMQKITSSDSGECWIPGVIGYLDTETSSRLYLMYSLLAVGQLQTLLILLHRIVKGNGGWEIDNRLMRNLVQDHMFYCGCSLVLFSPQFFFRFQLRTWLQSFTSLFKLSWPRGCTGTSGDQTVLLVASTQMPLSQRGWQQPQILFDGRRSFLECCDF
ncbi:hypothetical protein DFH29DRAFT_246702 [Suillus ampliporus]|nr:hypothetical protein DFH29DRAFT_246702 [Suillus ampliporus]